MWWCVSIMRGPPPALCANDTRSQRHPRAHRGHHPENSPARQTPFMGYEIACFPLRERNGTLHRHFLPGSLAPDPVEKYYFRPKQNSYGPYVAHYFLSSRFRAVARPRDRRAAKDMSTAYLQQILDAAKKYEIPDLLMPRNPLTTITYAGISLLVLPV